MTALRPHPSLVTRGLFAIVLVLAVSGCTEDEGTARSLATNAAAEGEKLPVKPAPLVRRAKPERALADGVTLEIVERIGLIRPMAVLYDPVADVYLVTNAGRAGYRGFITSLLPDGSVDTLRWVDGSADGITLYSPSAMSFVDNRLVVADGDHLRVFDRETGVPRGSVHIVGAVDLKDIAAGARGGVYVTDSGRSAGRTEPLGTVYRVNRRGKVSMVSKSSVLGRPTGVVVVGKTVWIAATDPEAFYGVTPNGHLTHGAALPAGGPFSGLTRVEDQLFFSSVETGTVYRGPLAGPFESVVTGIRSPGEVGWDAARNRLLVPRTADDRIEIHTFPGAKD